ncbi:hypothetical protein DFH11DRAFT_1541169 [Phellopilus nigrolimitatus]|nr:hypothetical protein DFH11DRAFT_1541169 [Phellopilus nigrolimitatus]
MCTHQTIRKPSLSQTRKVKRDRARLARKRDAADAGPALDRPRVKTNRRESLDSATTLARELISDTRPPMRDGGARVEPVLVQRHTYAAYADTQPRHARSRESALGSLGLSVKQGQKCGASAIEDGDTPTNRAALSTYRYKEVQCGRCWVCSGQTQVRNERKRENLDSASTLAREPISNARPPMSRDKRRRRARNSTEPLLVEALIGRAHYVAPVWRRWQRQLNDSASGLGGLGDYTENDSGCLFARASALANGLGAKVELVLAARKEVDVETAPNNRNMLRALIYNAHTITYFDKGNSHTCKIERETLVWVVEGKGAKVVASVHLLLHLYLRKIWLRQKPKNSRSKKSGETGKMLELA